MPAYDYYSLKAYIGKIAAPVVFTGSDRVTIFYVGSAMKKSPEEILILNKKLHKCLAKETNQIAIINKVHTLIKQGADHIIDDKVFDFVQNDGFSVEEFNPFYYIAKYNLIEILDQIFEIARNDSATINNILTCLDFKSMSLPYITNLDLYCLASFSNIEVIDLITKAAD